MNQKIITIFVLLFSLSFSSSNFGNLRNNLKSINNHPQSIKGYHDQTDFGIKKLTQKEINLILKEIDNLALKQYTKEQIHDCWVLFATNHKIDQILLFKYLEDLEKGNNHHDSNHKKNQKTNDKNNNHQDKKNNDNDKKMNNNDKKENNNDQKKNDNDKRGNDQENNDNKNGNKKQNNNNKKNNNDQKKNYNDHKQNNNDQKKNDNDKKGNDNQKKDNKNDKKKNTNNDQQKNDNDKKKNDNDKKKKDNNHENKNDNKKTMKLSKNQIILIKQQKLIIQKLDLSQGEINKIWLDFSKKNQIDYYLLVEYLKNLDNEEEEDFGNKHLTQKQKDLIEETISGLESQSLSGGDIKLFWDEFSKMYNINLDLILEYLEQINHKKTLTETQIELIEREFEKIKLLFLDEGKTIQHWIEFAKLYNIDKNLLFDYLKTLY